MLYDLIDAFGSGNIESLKAAFAKLILALPIVMLSLSVHETAHGYVAHKLGDPTARSLGRLSLNPVKHLDPIGFICMLCFGFGWAKPVPVNTRYFKKPRRDMALCGAAGPVSNLALAIIFTALLKIFEIITPNLTISSELGYNLLLFTLIFLQTGIEMNITLAVFNLIPCPPLDGSKILYAFIPAKVYYKIAQYERYVYIVLLIALALGVLDPVISTVTGWIMDIIFTVFAIWH